MIEGNLSDASLPGLLQFLATESDKTYKLRLSNGFEKGDIFINEGEILSANFGLLEGNDALAELLFWREGAFSVEKLASRFKATINANLSIKLKQDNSFADQILFLQESLVGLNTEIVSSSTFGTQEWQEALSKQPLYKEEFAVLGWLSDGRTMRQAMREFNFDVVAAASVLFRLLITGSVEVLKPSMKFATEDNLEVVSAVDLEAVSNFDPPQIESVAARAAAVTQEKLPAMELKITAAAAAAAHAQAQASKEVETSDSLPALPSLPDTQEDVDNEKKLFDMRRTDPLPLVAIDIERLFQTTFKVSPFGQLALNNEALDADLRALLGDYKIGKTLITAAFADGRVPGQSLHSTKYLLERGHIDPPDQVISLTADLLLGRIELEQYLLQRRRISGDELRDLQTFARQKGIKLSELLVKMGFMTQSDWDRLQKEKELFAPR